MDALAVLGAVAGLAVGLFAGVRIGRRLRAHRVWRFWLTCVISLLVGTALIYVGEMDRLPLLAGVGVGLAAGALNGVRWGYGSLATHRA
jgi:hypothetical protein